MSEFSFPGISDFLDIGNAAKPKMLFLDNKISYRHFMDTSKAKEFDFTLVRTVKQCLSALASEDYDLISMEHDLNESFEDPDSIISGMEVVRYIEKTGWPANKPKPRISVHSRNIFAAYLMVTRLNAMGFFAEWNPIEISKNDVLEQAES